MSASATIQKHVPENSQHGALETPYSLSGVTPTAIVAGRTLTVVNNLAVVMTNALPDGTYNGEVKQFIQTGTGDFTITPTTTLGGWATIKLTNVGDSATLQWVNDGTASGWVVTSRGSGVAATATTVAGLPVIA